MQPPCQNLIDIPGFRLKQIYQAVCGNIAAADRITSRIGTFVKNGAGAVKTTTTVLCGSIPLPVARGGARGNRPPAPGKSWVSAV
jgi:hypothetical protein